MSSIYARQDLTRGAIRKRKEPQPCDPPLSQIPVKPSLTKPAHPAYPAQAAKLAKPAKPAEPGNKLLAGYLAHEFLTKGTLFGKRLEPSRAEPKTDADPAQSGPSKPGDFYKEVSYLLKTDGVHIAGVVNPTQLGSWLEK